jgi:hypothetical protein
MPYPDELDNNSAFPVRVEGDAIPASDNNDKGIAIIAVETKLGTGASTPTTGKVLMGTGAGSSAWQDPTGAVTSVAGKTGVVVLAESDVTNLVSDLATKAPLASPALTGTPTAPSPTVGDNSTKIATTGFVTTAVAGAGSSPATFSARGTVRQREYNVKDYGAVADGKQVGDGAITASSSNLISATASFANSDVGKPVVVFGAGTSGANLATTIQSFTSSTTVVLAAPAVTTVSSANVLWGTDDTAAINAAIAAVSTTGGLLFFPPGQYCIAGTTTPIPGGIAVRGTGYDVVYPATTYRSKYQSVLFAVAVIPYALKLGTSSSNGNPGFPGTSLKEIVIDGCGLATDVVYVAGSRNVIESCWIAAGTATAINLQGQNTAIRLSYVSNEGVGTVINMASGGDNKIIGNNLKGSGPAGYILNVNGHCIINGNHIWQGSNGVPTAGGEILIGGSNFGVTIVNNLFDSTLSSHIYLAGGGEITITGNHFFMTTAVTDNTLSCIAVTGTVVSLTAMGNTFGGFGASNRYKAFITSGGTVDRSAAFGNVGNYAVQPFSGFVPTAHGGNMTQNGTSTSVYADSYGVSTSSGSGSATQFPIPHGLYRAPANVQVTAASAAAASAMYVTSDITNIYVNYVSAPTSGSNNVILHWKASV